ncbi:unnamed protein product [Thelazia callipaeda]|uniref:Homeobox domain-containing protein n=1 Tax=Thelazia callipaeda TaxID=103827 RepID=A0A0N5CVY1_THECL|nr:unnamed protein product [Thelazia callipaeda]
MNANSHLVGSSAQFSFDSRSSPFHSYTFMSRFPSTYATYHFPAFHGTCDEPQKYNQVSAPNSNNTRYASIQYVPSQIQYPESLSSTSTYSHTVFDNTCRNSCSTYNIAAAPNVTTTYTANGTYCTNNQIFFQPPPPPFIYPWMLERDQPHQQSLGCTTDSAITSQTGDSFSISNLLEETLINQENGKMKLIFTLKLGIFDELQ